MKPSFWIFYISSKTIINFVIFLILMYATCQFKLKLRRVSKHYRTNIAASITEKQITVSKCIFALNKTASISKFQPDNKLWLYSTIGQIQFACSFTQRLKNVQIENSVKCRYFWQPYKLSNRSKFLSDKEKSGH